MIFVACVTVDISSIQYKIETNLNTRAGILILDTLSKISYMFINDQFHFSLFFFFIFLSGMRREQMPRRGIHISPELYGPIFGVDNRWKEPIANIGSRMLIVSI